MKLVNIADEGAKYKWQLYDLYDKAFPEQEKKPLQVMENLVADGKMEMLAMVDEDEFVGLAINLIDAEQDRALLDYYAIVPEKRNYGYGGRNPSQWRVLLQGIIQTIRSQTPAHSRSRIPETVRHRAMRR